MIIYPCPHCGGLHKTPYVSAYICVFTRCLKSGANIVIKGNHKGACQACDKKVACLAFPMVDYKTLMTS